jgi:hypothetical protein
MYQVPGIQRYFISLETLDEYFTYAYAWQTQRPRTTQAIEERHARPLLVLRTRN